MNISGVMIGVAVTVVLFSAPATRAATFSATADHWQGSSCFDQASSANGVASASCLNTSAQAGPGRFSAFTRSVSNYSSSEQFYSGESVASAGFSDTLSFGIQNGTFTIPIEFLVRSTSVIPVKYASGINGHRVSAVGELGNTSIEASITYDSFGDPLITGTFGDVVKTDVTFDILNGKVSLTGGLYAYSDCSPWTFYNPLSGVKASCEMEADGSSSLRLLGGTVRDASGQIVSTSVVSESGWDYLSGYEPHELAAVPLPASIWMLGAAFGFGGLLLGRRNAGPTASL